VDRPERCEPNPHARIEPAGGIIIIERRDFVRGCLTCWLAQYCRYYLAAAVGDVESMQVAAQAPRCIAAMIGMSAPGQDDWLCRQIRVLRSAHPGIPIMLVINTEQVNEVEELATRLDLQGYIPSFSRPEVAAAAVHLVIAGGCYFPRSRPTDMLPGRDRPPAILTVAESLTSKQRLVFGLLCSGMPNKMIAQQLGMSLSTVKLHVHHIIRRLQVGNRTEVALLAQQHANTTDATIAVSAPARGTGVRTR
jgi:DNA-binding NarL/FixJ family response regulator